MGVSTDGILVFGFDLGCPGEDDGFPPALLDQGDQESDVYDIFEEMGGERDSCPVELVHHCSDGFVMWLLAIKGTRIRSSRGYPTDIPQSHFTVSPERIKKAKEWCEEHKISWETPEWLLASYWG